MDWNGQEWISYGPWLGAPRERRFFTEKRILVKQIIDWTDRRPWAAMTGDELYNTQNAFNLLPRPGWSCEFLLGLLNSRLVAFYHRKRFLEEYKMRFQKVLIKDCKQFPVPIEARADGCSAALAKEIGDTAAAITALVKQKEGCRLSDELNSLKREIASLDRRVDLLIYQLFGLADNEVALVESGLEKHRVLAATEPTVRRK